jgi:hypothetical protein
VGRRSEFEPAADDRAVHRGHDRRATELDRLERPVPHARMQHALERVEGFSDLGEVETGGEMLALAGEHDRANILRQPGEEGLDSEHGHVVESVALFRAGELEMRDGPAARRPERSREVEGERLFGRRAGHSRFPFFMCSNPGVIVLHRRSSPR